MKITVTLFAIWGLAAQASTFAQPLDLASVKARAFEDPGVARLRAELAERRRQLTSTGGFFREGPVVGVEAGPRRMEDDSTKADVAIEADVLLRLRGETLSSAAARFDEAAPVLLAAAKAEAERGLAAAYGEAWFAASRAEALTGQLKLLEGWREVARRRVEAGADAPFQESLVEGDLVRAEADLDRARREAAEAWGALRARADLPASPQPLALPRLPAFPGAGESKVLFDAGVARASIGSRLALDLAFASLDGADRRERWGLRGSLAREGPDGVARAGLSYRFALPGERSSGEEAVRALEAGRRRDADAEHRLLEARLDGALERVRTFRAVSDPKVFEEALAAVDLRVAEGKDRPSEAVLFRRQLVEARLSALERLRDAFLLAAELEALTKGMTP